MNVKYDNINVDDNASVDQNLKTGLDNIPSIQNIEFPEAKSTKGNANIKYQIQDAADVDQQIQDKMDSSNLRPAAKPESSDSNKIPETDAKATTKDELVDINKSIPTIENKRKDLPLCPEHPPGLIGRLATFRDGKSFEETGRDNPEVRLGGRYTPSTCTSRHRVAIVIPYRNREEHLKTLVRNLHPFLQRQQLDYGIYVIDQALPGRFNRAMLMNIGFVEAMKRHDYQCAVFHDVDLIPEDDRNIYSCPQQPRHLSASIDKFNYKLPYAGIYGGVSAINKKQFHELNGFSNLYFGWGGEDDDMAKRLSAKGYRITRYPMEIARYKMIQHSREKLNEVNPKRFELLRTTTSRQPWDGLNSLKYTVQQVEELPTHTRIQVLINEADLRKKP